MSKHTPGPWIEKPDGQGTYEVVENRVDMWLQPDDVGFEKYPVDVAGTVMSFTPSMNTIAFGPIGKANARLIAAAPEMYDLLKRIDDACLDYSVEAASIIEKIEGGK